VQPQIRAKKHAFIVDMPSVPIYVDADPVRLAQIVSNLLNNAARYTREGGRISLTVRREKNNAVVRVQDSGIGLSPEQMPHIFGMFTQVDRSAERGHGGLGVGLALSKQLVQLHGGSIEARSEGLGKGSEFIVRLPLADPPTPATSSGPAEVAPLSMKRVLIADDNIDSAMALSDLLALSGHDVHTVYDGLAAVETAKRVNPDVAILDIGMPKLDGYEVARRIRAEQLPMILIALTGWGQEQDRQQAREAGFDHHLTKPVDLAKLEELLQSSPQERH
jgi:CheY-like chemotaxis protein